MGGEGRAGVGGEGGAGVELVPLLESHPPALGHAQLRCTGPRCWGVASVRSNLWVCRQVSLGGPSGKLRARSQWWPQSSGALGQLSRLLCGSRTPQHQERHLRRCV